MCIEFSTSQVDNGHMTMATNYFSVLYIKIRAAAIHNKLID